MTHIDDNSAALAAFNCKLLDEALALTASYESPQAPPFDLPTGVHLRHVIEHYEALVFPARSGEVDYDSRRRDRELESRPEEARRRLLALRQKLSEWSSAPGTTLQVRGVTGVTGQIGFTVLSTPDRELAFLASHTVHHFALIRAASGEQQGALDANFGKAPATISYEKSRGLSRMAAASLTQLEDCT